RRPDVRFRYWLQQASHNLWCGLMEARVAAAGDGPTTPLLEILLSVEAHNAFLKALDGECSHARRREILSRVQSLAEGSDWEMFDRVVLRGESVAAVAAQLGCDQFTAAAAAHRVHHALQQEVLAMEDAL